MLQIKDWDTWQTYRTDRGTPPWIKVHRKIMTNKKWAKLSDAEKGQILSIWVVGADNDGKVPQDPTILKKVCQLDTAPNTQLFIDLGFLTPVGKPDDATVTPQQRQVDAPETETETETKPKTLRSAKPADPYSDQFEEIWKKYPRPLGKRDAWLRFKKQVVTDQDRADIHKALDNYKADVEDQRNNGHPDLAWQHGSTWFNNKWRDYVDYKTPKAAVSKPDTEWKKQLVPAKVANDEVYNPEKAKQLISDFNKSLKGVSGNDGLPKLVKDEAPWSEETQ